MTAVDKNLHKLRPLSASIALLTNNTLFKYAILPHAMLHSCMPPPQLSPLGYLLRKHLS